VAIAARFLAVCSVVSVTVITPVRAYAQSPHMPLGSFLRKPAATPAELAEQTANDPIVLGRYVQAFHIAPQELIRAFANLRGGYMPDDKVYEVHYVHPGEEVGYRLRRVRRGTPIWVSPDGMPVLVRVCGNPLRSGPNDALANAGAQVGRLNTVPDFEPDEPLDSLVSNNNFSLNDLHTSLPGTDLPSVAVTVPTPETLVEPSLVTPNVPSIVAHGLPSWVRSALAAGGVGSLTSFIHGGTSTRLTPNGTIGNNFGSPGSTSPGTTIPGGSLTSSFGGGGLTPAIPPTVPEPGMFSTAVALVGSAGLAFRWRGKFGKR
jgi:hypothetical protein